MNMPMRQRLYLILSIVAHPDQSHVKEGSLRFILSLRAVGEGHVSSLTFRSGVVNRDGQIRLDGTAALATLPDVVVRLNVPLGEQIRLEFSDKTDLSERVIFPVTLAQKMALRMPGLLSLLMREALFITQPLRPIVANLFAQSLLKPMILCILECTL